MSITKRIVILAMVLSILVVVSITVFAAGNLVQISPDHRYWVAYLGHLRHQLMEIDSVGNVLRTSQVKPETGEAGAISKKGDNRLNLWYLGHFSPPNFVWRSLINKDSLTTLANVRTEVKTMGPQYLQVTQRPRDNFLALRIGDFLTAFGISDEGTLNGESWPLFRSPFQETADLADGGRGGVSADGRFAYFIDITDTESQLFIQRLGSLGKPQGPPVLIDSWKTKARAVWCADITNVLSAQRRFVIYMVAVGLRPFVPPSVNDQLFLQVIDDSTGNKVGSRIPLRSYNLLESRQGLAVDPLGRFYISGVRDALHPGGPTGVIFQALDATGHASGSQRVLAPVSSIIVGVGLDILQE
jgi:hypothetical protein